MQKNSELYAIHREEFLGYLCTIRQEAKRAREAYRDDLFNVMSLKKFNVCMRGIRSVTEYNTGIYRGSIVHGNNNTPACSTTGVLRGIDVCISIDNEDDLIDIKTPPCSKTQGEATPPCPIQYSPSSSILSSSSEDPVLPSPF